MIDFSSIPKIPLEVFGPTNMYLALGFETIMAIILGGLIGMDREKKLKTAGTKTHMLICLGAMLYTSISHIANFDLTAQGYEADINRVSAQIVSGIGFLGAGAIIRNPKGVFGLTTAATIWVVAAIGLAIGSGFPISAFFFTVTVLFVLKYIDPAFRAFSGKSNYCLQFVGYGEKIPSLDHYFVEEKISINHHEVFHEDKNNKFILRFYVKVSNKNLSHLMFRIKNLDEIKDASYKQLGSSSSEYYTT